MYFLLPLSKRDSSGSDLGVPEGSENTELGVGLLVC